MHDELAAAREAADVNRARIKAAGGDDGALACVERALQQAKGPRPEMVSNRCGAPSVASLDGTLHLAIACSVAIYMR